MTREFVHLHSHTEYSMLDGAIRIPDLMKYIHEHGMSSVAITDHGNMFGAVEFYTEAMKKGKDGKRAYNIAPIIGCEVYMAPGDRRDKKKADKALGEEQAYHMLLLVQNEEGYRNLCRLVSLGYIEGYYYKPRVDWELLQKYNRGLVATSTCLGGLVAKSILANDRDKTYETIRRLSQIFEGRFYLELQENKIGVQRTVNDAKIALAKELGLPLVATNDNHYLCNGDDRMHDLLLAIGTGAPLNDEKRFRFETPEFWVKPPEVMWEEFAYCPEACENTVRIAESCTFGFDFSKHYLPKFDPDISDLDGALRQYALAGFQRRLAEGGIPREKEQHYRERLEYELGVIVKMGFPGYFLIVQDFINWAKGVDIPIGPGRGSAAGSLASYCLRITDIDPIKYNLLFERFLNPSRKSLPDIDVDICQDGRGRVIEYVTHKYGGSDHVAYIATFGHIKAKQSIKDVGRALGVPPAETDKICKLIGNDINATLKSSYDTIREFKQTIDNSSQYTEIYQKALGIEGIKRQPGIHAAGLIITDNPITDYAPLYRKPDGDQVAVQYGKDYVEKIGLVKFDFLGLANLTILDKAVKFVKRFRGVDVNLETLPFDDPETYKLLQRGEGMGVFQLESEGMCNTLRKLKPTVFEDLIAVLALYRPGPLNSGIVDDFIDRKNGRVPVTYALQGLDRIMGETYGMLVYQEQIMQLAVELAGFSMPDADELRKIISKKQADKMEAEQNKLIEGMVARGHPRQTCVELVEMIGKFAEYGFNKSHSAAYAVVTYRTAWMKAHFPVEFRAALMSSQGNLEDVIKFVNEARNAGIEVLPPDVNTSESLFAVREGKIVFGLASVRNLGAAAVDDMVAAREAAGGRFKDVFQFMKSVSPTIWNSRKFEACIESGAMDSFGLPRATLLHNLPALLAWVADVKASEASGQTSLFGGSSGDVAPPGLQAVPEWGKDERLARELSSIGFYISGNPLDPYRAEIRKYATTNSARLGELANRAKFKMAVVVQKVATRTSKDGRKQANVTCMDYEGVCEFFVSPKHYEDEAVRALLVPGTPVFWSGSVARDEDEGGDEEGQGASANIRLFTDAVMPLGDVQSRFATEVRVAIQSGTLGGEQVPRLRNLIKASPGQAILKLEVIRPGDYRTTLELGKTFGCTPNQAFLKGLEAVMGHEARIQVF